MRATPGLTLKNAVSFYWLKHDNLLKMSTNGGTKHDMS